MFDALLVVDADTRTILDCNPAAERMFGHERQDMIGSSKAMLHVDQERFEAFQAMVAEAVAEHGALRLARYSMRRSSGAVFPTEHSVHPINDADGRVVALISTVHDVSRQVMVEDALREGGRRYRGLFENSPVALLEEDLSGISERLDRIMESGVRDLGAHLRERPEQVRDIMSATRLLDCNQAALSLFGAESKDRLLRDFPSVMTEETLAIAAHNLASLAQGGGDTYETSYRRLDGGVIRVIVRFTVLPGYEKTLERVLMSLLDITHRKDAENALRQSEERYRALFESAADALFVVDTQGRFLEVNDVACRGLGYSREELLGMGVKDITPPDWPRGDKAGLLRAIHSQGSAAFESRHLTRDGRLIPVEVRARSFRFRDREVHMSTARDITEQIRAREAAEAASMAKSRFLANMSHEIRTPLNGIIGLTDLTMQGPLDEDQRTNLTMVAHSARSLLRIMNDILDLSKIESGRQEPAREEFSPAETVRAATLLFTAEARSKGLEMSSDTAPGTPPVVRGDPGRLRQMLVNLVGNAVKFTEQGSVRLSCRALDATHQGRVRLEFTVRDTGIGIADKDQDTIFEPFVQADGSLQRAYMGTGLGLSITRRLARLMDGEVSVSSQPGKGSIFTVTAVFELPRSQASGPDAQDDPRDIGSGPGSGYTQG